MGHGDRIAEVAVFAPARLHFGFLDLHGGLGRRFGSLGLVIDGFRTRLRVTRAAEPSVTGPQAERALQALERAAFALGLPANAHIAVEDVIPDHVGLGSGTQLGLAVGVGLSRLHGRRLPTREVANAVGRGARSGIGIGAFDLGGFLVDGGLGPATDVAPVISRLEFPPDWRLLLILDPKRQGLSGAVEKAAFSALPVFPESLSGRLCRILVMQLLPGLAEGQYKAVADALGEIQDRIGDYFSPLQNGRYTSSAVAEVLAWLHESGITGIGQSSWGPTGFALFQSADQAASVAAVLADRFGGRHELEFRVVAGRNSGAEIAEKTAL